jgi:FAD/FMN-containing dehydrogenase
MLTRRELTTRALAAGAGLALPGWMKPPAAPAAAPRDPRLRELARATHGPLLLPGGRGYVVASRVYNRRFDGRRPLAVLQPTGVEDVRAAVRWAAKHDLRLAARSGGHSYGGYSTVHRGLVVDLRRLRGVSVSRAGGTVRVQAGAQLIDVYSRLAADGATIPAGTCPSVGVGGLVLGGGMGLASRALGLTCDRVRAVEIVTADARARRATAGDEADLFWACRGGGGGNFGIATAFELRVHRVRHAAYFFVSWPWEQAAEALRAWMDFAPHTANELTSVLSLSTGSPGPRVTALGQLLGSPARLRSLVGPLARVPGARLSTGESAYLDLVRRWAGCLDLSVAACHTAGTRPGGTLDRARFAARSDYVGRAFDAAGRAAVITAVERRQRQGAGSGALLFDAYGGAINRMAADATAFVHRDALCSIQELAYFTAEGTGAALRWLDATGQALRPYVTGAAYQNYIDPRLENWPEAYYGANLERLRAVKAQVDPDGVFRFAQGI